MSELVIDYAGKPHKLRFCDIDRTNKQIRCLLDDESEPSLYIEYPLTIDDSYNPADYQLFLLVKKGLLEKEILQVYDKQHGQRIGWSFPIQALCSIEHSFADNEHFLRYAYVGAVKLISDCPQCKHAIIPQGDLSILSFSNFFPEEVALLVLCNKQLKRDQPFDINVMVPSLFSHGYVLLGERNPSTMSVFTHENCDIRMNLTQLPDCLEDNPFIASLFIEMLAYENHVVLRYFLVYQIIELLIAKIFDHEYKRLSVDIINAGSDQVKIRKMVEKISDYVKEDTRLRLLASDYKSYAPDKEALQTVCKAFLEANANTCLKDDAYDMIYHIRNLIFHRFREVKRHDLLENVVQEFIPFVIDLLLSFRLPETMNVIGLRNETKLFGNVLSLPTSPYIHRVKSWRVGKHSVSRSLTPHKRWGKRKR